MCELVSELLLGFERSVRKANAGGTPAELAGKMPAVRICESRRGFTFIEVLAAAMLFMAILIPAAVEGLLIANRAGVVAERKRVAAQLADRLLTETMATEEWRQGNEEGNCGEEWPGYRWTLTTDAWEEDTMRAVTVRVFFTAQGREYHVALTTLAKEETETAGTAQQ